MGDWKFVASLGVYCAGLGILLYALGQPWANAALALPEGWPEVIGSVAGGLIGAGGAYLGVRFEHRETARRERQTAAEQRQEAQDQLKALLAAELVQIASTVAVGARQMLDKAGQRMAGVVGNVLAYSEPPRAFQAMLSRLDSLAPHASTHLLFTYATYDRLRANHAQWRMLPEKTEIPPGNFGVLLSEWQVLIGSIGVALSIFDADMDQSPLKAICPECAPTLRAEINRLSDTFRKYAGMYMTATLDGGRNTPQPPPES